MKPKLQYRLLVAAAIAASFAVIAFVAERTLFAAEPPHIILTYSGPPETSIDINLVMPDRVDDVRIHYDTESHAGRPGDYAHEAHARHVDAVMELSDERALYVAEIEGLQPGTVYYFVTRDARGHISREHKFRTLPGGDEPFRFVNGGDMGVDGLAQTMLSLAGNTDPDFALIGGDLAYENGLLTGNRKWDHWLANWERHMVTSDGRMVPIVAAIGNHETNDYESDALELRAPWFVGLFGRQGPDVYWTLHVGSLAVFYLLDSGHLVDQEGAQADWLDREMDRYENTPYTFAAYHVPLYPAHSPFDSPACAEERAVWGPLFDRYRLDVAFEHHDHVLKRSKPLRGGKISEGGTVYVGDGCFGRSARTVDPQPRWYNEKEAGVEHFWLIEVGKDTLDLEAIDKNGDTVDKFSLPRR